MECYLSQVPVSDHRDAVLQSTPQVETEITVKRKGKQIKQDELVKPIDVGDIHNKHEDQFEKMLKGKLLNQKETLIKATTTGIETKLFENTPFA